MRDPNDTTLLPIVNFYFKQPQNLIQYLLTLPFAYGHCSLSIWIKDQDDIPREWVLDYSRHGYRMVPVRQMRAPNHMVPVTISNPQALLQWRNPKRQSRFATTIQILLAVIFPRKYNNCASTISRAINLTARTPDSLYRQLRTRP